jgi:type IV secretion system protein VirB9
MTLVWTAALALFVGQLGELSTPTDPRIQVIAYNPGQVVTLSVADGYATVVELGPEERVDSVVVGNAAGWQVTASRRGDHVVVKPLAGATQTDMIVITAERRFVFLLQPASAGGPQPFVIRFVYPEPRPLAVTASALAAATFQLRGNKALLPLTMQDDGVRTRITWRRDTPVPAIFAVDRNGREAIVNGRMVGADFIVERIAERFVFRRGNERASATRKPIRSGR